MGIQEDIFNEFFGLLRADEEFPNSIADELQKCWEKGELLSQEKVFGIIKRGCPDEHQNKED